MLLSLKAKKEVRGEAAPRERDKTQSKTSSMPESSSGWTSADTAAAAQVAVSAINYASAANTNKKQRKWMDEAYAKQRADALADWTMQNQYNSPAEQMKRLKEAGLNPNLVYGHGATTEAGTVRSSDTGSYRPEAPKLNEGAISNTIQYYQDTKLKQAQIDQLAASTASQKQEAVLKAAQTAATLANVTSTGVKTEQDRLNLKLGLENFDATVQAAQLRNLKLQADTQYTLDQNERAAATNAQNLQVGAEQILNMRATRAGTQAQLEQTRVAIENLRKDGVLKDLDIQLRNKGIMPGDPMWTRIAAQIVGDPGKAVEKAKEILKSLQSGPSEVQKAYMEKYGPLPF